MEGLHFTLLVSGVLLTNDHIASKHTFQRRLVLNKSAQDNEPYATRTRWTGLPLRSPIRPYQLLQLVSADLPWIERCRWILTSRRRLYSPIAEVLLINLVGMSCTGYEHEGDTEGRSSVSGWYDWAFGCWTERF